MKLLKTLLLTLSLVLTPLWAYGDGQIEHAPADSPETPSVEKLIAELMTNVDMDLMIRIQTAMMNNIDIIGPYTQEYLACLKAEGTFDSEQSLNLKGLIEQAKKTGDNCQVILESLIGQMKFDITEDEFKQGLSPEYRELLQL